MDPMAAEGLTDGMTHLAREIPQQDYGRHTKRFGQKEIRRAQKQCRRFKAVVEQLEEVGFYNIERDIKLENLEEIDEETWNHYATDRAEHEQKMKGGKRKAQQEENRTPKPKISPHAALATAVAAEVRRPSRKTRRPLATNEGLPQLKRPHRATTVGKSRSNIPPPAPTHALEEDADAEAVVRREAADEDTAADTPKMDRSTSRTLNASNVGALGITPTSSDRAQFARRITSANRPQAGDNLHNHLTKSSVARAARGQRRDVSLARLELYDNRGNTYPIKIVDNFFVEVAPPLDFDMTIDTTFHQSPTAYAIHALEGLRLP
ncbi:hypothetical protein RI054_10g53620 [Pseudoscourfieldia marina]